MNWRNYVPSQLHYALFRPTYLFVHIPKNGGMSIRKSPELFGRILRRHENFIGGRAYTQAVYDASAALGRTGVVGSEIGHARLRDYNADLQAKLRPFAILRNPWSRTVSRYTYMLKVQQRQDDGSRPKPISFEAFLEQRHLYGGKPYLWQRVITGWFDQLDYVVDAQGVIRTENLRLERLSAEAKDYFHMQAPLPKIHRSVGDSVDYRTFYTPATIQIVADWHKADIDAFGFDFDTPARRNVFFDAAHAG